MQSVTKTHLLKQAEEWAAKALKLKGDARHHAQKRAASFRYRAKQLGENLAKHARVSKHAKAVAKQVIGVKASMPSTIVPFSNESIQLRVTDYQGRGDIVIERVTVWDKHITQIKPDEKGRTEYRIHVELKDSSRSTWLTLAEVKTIAKAIQTLSAYLMSNIGAGFYDEE